MKASSKSEHEKNTALSAINDHSSLTINFLNSNILMLNNISSFERNNSLKEVKLHNLKLPRSNIICRKLDKQTKLSSCDGTQNCLIN